MSEILGNAAKLYLDATPLSSTPDSGSWSEVDLAREVTINMDAARADVTRRGSGNWKQSKAGLIDATLEFEVVYDPTDTEFQALLDAFTSRGEIALAAMDGDIAVADTEGLAGNWEIVTFNRSEPLDDAITVSITAAPSGYTTWYTVAS